jgi:hypothetical protein
MNGRYAMANIFDQRLLKDTEPKYMLQFEGDDHYENEFSEIEWALEEESLLPVQPEVKEEGMRPEIDEIPDEVLQWLAKAGHAYIPEKKKAREDYFSGGIDMYIYLLPILRTAKSSIPGQPSIEQDAPINDQK